MDNKNRTPGFAVWARKTLDSDIFLLKPDSWFKIWFYIVMKANFDGDKRGTVFTTYENISSGTSATRNNIDSFIRWAKSADMLTTRKTTRGFYITVLNYAKYQDKKKSKTDTKTDGVADTQPIRITNTIADESSSSAEPIALKDEDPTPERIAELIFLFKASNPMLEYGNRTQRGAAAKLIKERGYETAKAAAEEAVKAANSGNRFAPVITSPHELIAKYGKLRAYLERQ